MNQYYGDRPGRLAQKIVLVTGAASGIGRAVAEVAAREDGDIVLVDYDGEAAQAVARGIGSETLSIRADISNADDVNAAVELTVRRHGRIDVLVNVAGVHDMMVPVEEMTEGKWKRLFDINVLGTALMMQSALLQMLPARSGSIVNTSSTSAYKGGLGGAAYSSSKGAIVTLTRQVARDVAARGVRVNAVAPGPTVSNILQTAANILGSPGEPGPMAKYFMDQTIRDSLRRVPMGRFAAAEEVARAIVFLASDDASYITGATLAVDGGQLID